MKTPTASVVDTDVYGASVLAAPLNEADAVELAHGFAALGDPARLQSLSLIADAPQGEECACAGSSARSARASRR